jgi:hypothetical protein
MPCSTALHLFIAGVTLLSAGCRSSAPVVPMAESSEASILSTADDARGGRLYDKWYAELDLGFVPGAAGGPHGDGTLDDGQGAVMQDDGHGYRLKNLFGWDLRGTEGIYGPAYQNRPWVRPINLLVDDRTVPEIADWLEHGDAQTPAFGAVMPREAIEEIAVFIVGVRTGTLPRPDEVWALSESAPMKYVLQPGAEATRGAQRITEHCGCHGPTGMEITIDDSHSLGSYARTKAYEAWLKVLNGHPGSPMGRELDLSSGDEPRAAVQILEILAALCDRTRYPPKEHGSDVPDDDPACGEYLR